MAIVRTPPKSPATTPKQLRIINQPLPDFKNIKSKIGSTENIKYQPKGGQVMLFSHASLKTCLIYLFMFFTYAILHFYFCCFCFLFVLRVSVLLLISEVDALIEQVKNCICPPFSSKYSTCKYYLHKNRPVSVLCLCYKATVKASAAAIKTGQDRKKNLAVSLRTIQSVESEHH